MFCNSIRVATSCTVARVHLWMTARSGGGLIPVGSRSGAHAVKSLFMAEHYFSSHDEDGLTPRPLTVELEGSERHLVTASGVFSPKGLDKGTAVLLREAPEPRGNSLLDIGCGWGPITLTLALRRPGAQVLGVDVNQRSIELTRRNAASMGLDTISTALPDDVDPGLTFDTIWSNPPIRVGKDVLHDILMTWLPRLSVGGSAYLVVQKNLGADSLIPWLAQNLGAEFAVHRYATSKGFRVIEVRRGPAQEV